MGAECNERQIAELLLEAMPALFAPLPITTAITLTEWQRTTPDEERRQRRENIPIG